MQSFMYSAFNQLSTDVVKFALFIKLKIIQLQSYGNDLKLSHTLSQSSHTLEGSDCSDQKLTLHYFVFDQSV